MFGVLRFLTALENEIYDKGEDEKKEQKDHNENLFRLFVGNGP